MITNISLRNFKAFEEETIELGALNLLSGLNNSGKSSVIQALRLLREQKPLNGLGPLREYIRNDSVGFNLECTQTIKSGINSSRFSFERKEETIECSGQIEGVFSYISADRYGPRNSLPLSIGGRIETVGCYGENIVDFLSLFLEKLDLDVPEPLRREEGNGMKYNIQEWLRVISPGINFDYKGDTRTDIGHTSFNEYRPVHVGFGLSYTLPIITSVLIHAAQCSVGDITQALLLIENPEAHLHPSGQTMMGHMLARAASCGLQIVIETHSDHLMNGVRIAVKEKVLPCDDVNFYFFRAAEDDIPTTMQKLTLDEHGMLEYWPDGFFDETEKNLMHLI
jgi:predicted ATPase